jgi:hypothetical protein
MLISYCGNRKNKASDGKSFNTESHIALTLQKLGHTVNFIQEDEIQFGTLPSRVAGSDIFLWTRTCPDKVLEADLKAIEAQGIPTVSFHLDKYTGIARDGGMSIGSTFWKTQFVFSPEGGSQAQEIFKLHGINQFYLPAGVFEDECYIAEPVDEFRHGIVFVGGGVEYMHKEWEYRGLLVRWLQEAFGDRFVKYGAPQRWLRGADLNKLYASSKIVIGDTLCKDFTDSFYYSDRAFETTGRGGFLIHPYIPGITDHFVDRKEVVLYSYGNFTQLENLIRYYLDHEDERRAIQLAGHERTKNTNTYTHRMQQMLAVLKEEGAI